MIDLRLGDCLDVLPTLADGSVDAVVTDPPYCSGSVGESQRTASKGQGLRSENIKRFGWFVGDNMGTAGLVWLLRSVAVASVRLLKPTGHLLVFCDWRMYASIQPAIESAGLRFQNLIVWNKKSMGLGVGFRRQHELILHFSNGRPTYHDQSTGNVLSCSRVHTSERKHQTQKPVDLMQQLLRVVVPPGGVVLDPFMGSGSTGKAAVMEGMRFIGIERDPAYHAIARQRIEAEIAGTTIIKSVDI